MVEMVLSSYFYYSLYWSFSTNPIDNKLINNFLKAHIKNSGFLISTSYILILSFFSNIIAIASIFAWVFSILNINNELF